MLELEMSVAGLDEVKALLEQVQSLPSQYSAASLVSSGSADILKYLAESGRDFVSPDAGDVGKIEQAAAAVLQRQVDKALVVGSTAVNAGWAQETQGEMLKTSLQVHAANVADNIAKQDAEGGLRPLTPEYAKQKQRKYGFTSPIGVATGKLLASLKSLQNIKLEK